MKNFVMKSLVVMVSLMTLLCLMGCPGPSDSTPSKVEFPAQWIGIFTNSADGISTIQVNIDSLILTLNSFPSVEYTLIDFTGTGIGNGTFKIKDSSPDPYIVNYTTTNTSPLTLTFDRLGFLSYGGTWVK